MNRFLYFLCLLVLPGCKSDDSESELRDIEEVRLEIVDHKKVPAMELSGVALATSESGQELLMISDKDFSVRRVGFHNGFRRDVGEVDLSSMLADNRTNGSQWEAIAVDAEHTFIMREHPPTMFVANRTMNMIIQTISLEVPESSELVETWESDANSLGEGLVLLNNGHIIVAKEKSPVQLIEFGPESSVAEGYRPELALASGSSMPLANRAQIRFVPLKVWDIGRSSAEWLEDVSDLAVGKNGRLHLLSDQSARIVAIEKNLDTSESRFKIKASWQLPKKIKKAEGLTFTSEMEPIVVSDGSTFNRNLFLLNQLP